ncbi:UDP-N-acetylglucosamine--N-acetylmuramyl-(pentapeptide) pyrophosphoryl-undecaprenol N-acetylglucosamine transferase [Bienertia sinuspersici]
MAVSNANSDVGLSKGNSENTTRLIADSMNVNSGTGIGNPDDVNCNMDRNKLTAAGTNNCNRCNDNDAVNGGVNGDKGMEEAGSVINDRIIQNNWLNVIAGSVPSKTCTVSNETHVDAPVKIDLDDIHEELVYWSSAMVVYVLGANPPFSVFNGYCHRVWGKKGLDKVLLVGKGLYLVRFNSVEQREQIWNDEPKFFDSKPVIIKRWDPDMELHKETIKTVPIWIRFPKLELKYWGHRSYSRITNPGQQQTQTGQNPDRMGQQQKTDRMGQQQPPQHILQGPMSDETEGVAKGSCRPLLQTRSSAEQQRPNTTQQQQLTRANNGADVHGQAQSQTAIQTKVSTGNVQGVDIGDIGEFTPVHEKRNKANGNNKHHTPISNSFGVLDDEMEDGQDVIANYQEAKTTLEETQSLMHQYPQDPILATMEKQATETFRGATKSYNSWLKQKAKIHWLQDGDTNSKIFFNSLRVRTYRNNINRVQNTHGIWVEDHDSITRAFTDFYTDLLQGSDHNRRLGWTATLFRESKPSLVSAWGGYLLPTWGSR